MKLREKSMNVECVLKMMIQSEKKKRMKLNEILNVLVTVRERENMLEKVQKYKLGI